MSTATHTTTAPTILRLRAGGELSKEATVSASRLSAPLRQSGIVDKEFVGRDVTPVIGREYDNVQLSQWLERPDCDSLLTELASIISHRNVVFFKNQDITPQQMLVLGEKLHELAGAPALSSHHVHPITNETSELGTNVYTINSRDYKKRSAGTDNDFLDTRNRWASINWHSDITWEPVPSDYAMLKVHTCPKSGGDTLWASAYEAYDRLSPEMAKFLEGLTANHSGAMFYEFAKGLGKTLLTDVERGNPLNYGPVLEANHPVIRVNPVTGWKGLFVNRAFTKRINGVTKHESDMLLEYCFKLLTENHDLQVRYRWSPNDLAIWDNRSSYHSATQDFDPEDVREGDRVCTLGEKPYFTAESTSRREWLAAQ